MLHKFNYQPIEQPILAKDVVRFVGEPIAAVVAPTNAAAEDLADAVEVEIEELPAVIDAREALKRGAPLVHDKVPSNTSSKAASRPRISTRSSPSAQDRARHAPLAPPERNAA
jgi:CO/xanthine dehydrogenase Mo-binding subunit